MRPCRRIARLCASCVIGIAAAASMEPAFGADAAHLDVRYRAGGLSVRIEGVPLDDVLAAVARETGMTIRGEPLDARMVSKRFDAVPLGLALRRLVGRQNFVLRYRADGSPGALDLLGAPLGRPAPVRRRNTDVLRLLLAHAPVSVPARTARALGGERVPLHRLLAGLRLDDPLVRAEVAAVLTRSIEDSPSLLAAVDAMDGEQLARFLWSQSGAHAEEIAADLYRAARDPSLRARLGIVIATLQRMIG